ncbi:MAG: hypothetical protein ACE5HI_16475, partial [bacterium]
AKTIYVAATTGGKIHVYSRDGATNDLQFVHDIKLGTGVDNIELDTAGNIWVAAHPKLLTFVKHAKDPQKLSPSQILKITPSGENHYQIDEIFLDDGKRISGSSVGAVFEQKLLIGSVFEDHFLMCDLTNLTKN